MSADSRHAPDQQHSSNRSPVGQRSSVELDIDIVTSMRAVARRAETADRVLVILGDEASEARGRPAGESGRHTLRSVS